MSASDMRLLKNLDPDDPTKGSITYHLKDSKTPAGIFSTAYYFRETDCTTCTDFKGQDSPWVKTDVYKTGILQYLQVTDLADFDGWKVIIYIDAHSFENPLFKSNSQTNQARIEKHKEDWSKIESHRNVIFGVIDWPEYAVGSKGDGKTIDNAIIRALRMKAFHDFAPLPVFVRDADTLFENLIKGENKSIVRELGLWEKTLRDNLEKRFADPSPYKFLIASQPNYQRQWHVHPVTGAKTTGCYAAVTSSLGGIPEWADGSLWKKCLVFLRANSKVIQSGNSRTPNNIDKPTYIGKDEQLLSYVIIPSIFEKVYFFYMEYIQVEGGPVIAGPDTPFAQLLLDKGITQYPSPYRVSLKEDMTQLTEGKRKDANETTEKTLLNPAIIPLCLSESLNAILKTIFRYFLTGAGTSSLQVGGRGNKYKRKRKNSTRRRNRRRHTSHKRK